MRRSVRIALSSALAVGLLALLAYAIGWHELLVELRGADPGWLALAVGVSLLSLVAWGEEVVRLLQSAGGDAGGASARLGYFSGVFGKLIVPGGHIGGMGVVAYVLGEQTAEPFERTLVAVSGAEFLNNIASATLATIGVVYLVVSRGTGGDSGRVVTAAVIAVVLLVAGLAATYVLLVRFDGAERLLRWVAGVGRRTVGRVSERARSALAEDRVENRLDNLRDTIDAMRSDRRTLLVAAAIGHVGWVCYALPLYFSLQAVGASVSFPIAFFVVPVAGLAGVVSTPGGVGAIEGATVGVLVLLTPVPEEVALAATVLFRAVTYGLTLLATGLIAIYVVAAGRADPFEPLRS